MNTDSDGDLVPQIEEGITKVSWVGKDQISEKLTNSYGNISDVLNRIFQKVSSCKIPPVIFINSKQLSFKL